MSEWWWGIACSGRRGKGRKNLGRSGDGGQKCNREPTNKILEQYLGFTQFVEEPTCTKKVNLASGDEITKSDGMEPKALEVQEKPKALSLEGT
jgi:hypothetical protein